MRDGGLMRGEVHDPRAFALGGVAGNAGLFATADDVARFAQAMLGHGARAGTRLVSEKTFDRFLTRHELALYRELMRRKAHGFLCNIFRNACNFKHHCARLYNGYPVFGRTFPNKEVRKSKVTSISFKFLGRHLLQLVS
jgi:CubicO group peptidase (beta-lactamase class C family)